MSANTGQGPSNHLQNYFSHSCFCSQLELSNLITFVTANTPQLFSGLKRSIHHKSLSQALYKHGWLASFERFTKHLLPHNSFTQQSQTNSLDITTSWSREGESPHSPAQTREQQWCSTSTAALLPALHAAGSSPAEAVRRDHNQMVFKCFSISQP